MKIHIKNCLVLEKIVYHHGNKKSIVGALLKVKYRDDLRVLMFPGDHLELSFTINVSILQILLSAFFGKKLRSYWSDEIKNNGELNK